MAHPAVEAGQFPDLPAGDPGLRGTRWGSGLSQREGIHTLPGPGEARPHWAGPLLDSGHELRCSSLRETPSQTLEQCVSALWTSRGPVSWTHKINCPMTMWSQGPT